MKVCPCGKEIAEKEWRCPDCWDRLLKDLHTIFVKPHLDAHDDLVKLLRKRY